MEFICTRLLCIYTVFAAVSRGDELIEFLDQAEHAREDVESSLQENARGDAGQGRPAGTGSGEVDWWSRAVSSLSTDQRIGLHMLGMQRTWQTVSNIFAAWSSLVAGRQGGPRSRGSSNCAPQEPDFSPGHLPSTLEVRAEDTTELDPGSIYSTPPRAANSLSPVVPAVVMSNFPRQQVLHSLSSSCWALRFDTALLVWTFPQPNFLTTV